MTAFATYPSYGTSTRPRWQAFGMAATLEAAIVVAVLAGAARHVQHEDARVLTIDLSTPTPPVAPAPKPDIPPPRAKAVQVPQVELPVIQEPVQPTPVAPPTPIVAREPEKEAPAIVAHAAPPPPPPASAPLSADYIAKMQAAVQAAFQYPMAAKALDFKGRARVAFSMVDTRPSGARIIVSSGLAIMDRAALHAVEAANFPPAPDGQGHIDRIFDVWVGYVE